MTTPGISGPPPIRPEVWYFATPRLGGMAALAERIEAAGYDGLALPDSQSIAPDPYVALALAAKSTSRLGLATGVTNPFTRHPAVTAASIATVQAESSGRAVLGIGRGDSSLAFLGFAPAPVARFERYLTQLQSYLAGDAVPFDAPDQHGLTSAAKLGLDALPEKSALAWLPATGQPKVPVDVACTGPRVISLAARHADRLTFAVGAEPERVQWAVETARRARTEAGGDPSTLSLGAWVNIAPHEDIDVSRRLVAGGLSAFGRISALHGAAVGPRSDDDRRMLHRLRSAYDMNRHAAGSSPQVGMLTADFIDRNAVVGSAKACVRRLEEMVDLGIERFVFFVTTPDVDREQAARSTRLIADEILPALH